MVKAFTEEIRQHVLNGGFLECKYIHDHSCEVEALVRFTKIFKLAAKFYFPIHLIPTLIFRRKELKKKPLETFKKFVIAYLKSVLMLAGYIAIFRYGMCSLKNLRQKMDKKNIIVSAFIAPFTLLIEPAGRRAELTLYMIPRFAESVWNFLLKRGLVKNITNGEVIVFAIAMAVICYSYQNEQDAIKPTYLNIFKKFYGEN